MNPFLALIFANIIWGAAPPIFKFALTNIPPMTLAFIRFFCAAFLFLPFLKGLNLKGLTLKDWTEIILGSFFGITVNIIFFFLGLKRTQSINASIIGSAGPVFIYFLSIWFLKEKPKLKVLLGMIIALFGVFIIILSPIFLDGKNLVIGEIEGNLFYVLATIGAVLCPILFKNVLKKINPFQLTLVSFVIGAATLLPFMLFELNTWSLTQLNFHGLLGIFFGVFFSSALAYFLFNYGLSKINTQEVGLFSYIDPVITVIIAIPLIQEYPNIYFLIGSIFVFGGILLAEGRIHWHPFYKFKAQMAENPL